MLRRHIVLLIAIHPSDGDVKPDSPLGAFQEEQAMCQHRVSPSPFHHYLTLVLRVMWSAQAVHESKIDHTLCHLSTLCETPNA